MHGFDSQRIIADHVDHDEWKAANHATPEAEVRPHG
jgi:hypothetical protein